MIEYVLVKVGDGQRFKISKKKALIMQALIQTEFNGVLAAKLLGISRQRVNQVKQEFVRHGVDLNAYSIKYSIYRKRTEVSS